MSSMSRLRNVRCSLHAPAAALLTSLLYCGAARATDSPISFSGISLGPVSQPAGQNFPYIPAGGGTEFLNVRLLSGNVSSLQPGASPDQNGFYVLQSAPLTPMSFRFTFPGTRAFVINSNETLTARETNSFTLGPGSGPWTVLGSSDVNLSQTASNVTFVGLNDPPGPYGQFSISATADSFDFEVDNAPGFSLYGSAISILIPGNTLGVSPWARPGSALQLRILPNPIRSRLRFQWSAPRPGGVACEVFDVSGRVVRR